MVDLPEGMGVDEMAGLRTTGVVATTHMVTQAGVNQRFTKEALEDMARQMNTGAVPVRLTHDSTSPTVARNRNSWVQAASDGEFELWVEQEFLSDSDFPDLDPSIVPTQWMPPTDRGLPVNEEVDLRVTLLADPTSISEKDIDEFRKDIGPTTELESQWKLRHALLPGWEVIAIVAGAWLLKSFLTSFGSAVGHQLGQTVGADLAIAYRRLRHALVNVFRRTKKPGEHGIVLVRWSSSARPSVTIEAAYKGGSPDDLSSALAELPALAHAIEDVLSRSVAVDISKLTLIYDEGGQQWVTNYIEFIDGLQALSAFGKRNVEGILAAMQAERQQDQ